MDMERFKRRMESIRGVLEMEKWREIIKSSNGKMVKFIEAALKTGNCMGRVK